MINLGMVENSETAVDAAQREFTEEVIGFTDFDTLDATLKADLDLVFEHYKIVDQTYGKFPIVFFP